MNHGDNRVHDAKSQIAMKENKKPLCAICTPGHRVNQSRKSDRKQINIKMQNSVKQRMGIDVMSSKSKRQAHQGTNQSGKKMEEDEGNGMGERCGGVTMVFHQPLMPPP